MHPSGRVQCRHFVHAKLVDPPGYDACRTTWPQVVSLNVRARNRLEERRSHGAPHFIIQPELGLMTHATRPEHLVPAHLNIGDLQGLAERGDTLITSGHDGAGV
jgi:hypothetical protein